jgi:predicted phosphodiesterase
VRIAIISDIHGNWEALQAIYRALTRRGFDRLVCLGDIVGYGPDPVRCIDFLIEHDILCLKGNHDAFAADIDRKLEWEMQDYARTMILWTQSQLDKARLRWLDRLPLQAEVEGTQMVHASLECVSGEYWPYILDKRTAQFHFYLQESRVAFCGHVHIPLVFTASGGVIRMEMLRRKRLSGRADVKTLVSVGSTGQPRDMDWRAAAVIYNTVTGYISPVRAEYDVEAVRGHFRRPGMPSLKPERIFRG